MTLPVQSPRVKYLGTGSVSTYSFPFKFTNASHLQVTQFDDTGIATLLSLTTDYTVTGVGASGGGSITLTAGNLTDGYSLVIKLVPSFEQDASFKNQGAFFAATHEDAFDHQGRISQALKVESDRSIKLSDYDVGSFDPSLPSNLPDNPGALLAINEDGDGFDIGPTTDEIFQAAADAATAAGNAQDAMDAAIAAQESADEAMDVALAAQSASVIAQEAAELAQTGAEEAQTAAEAAQLAAEQAAESANALPIGGTTGQYLKKASETNFDAEWEDFAAADIPVAAIDGLTATDVQAAIAEIIGVLDNLSPDADGVNYDGTSSGLTATDVQAAIDEVVGALDDHLNDTTDAHAASAISFDGTASELTATDVQSAIDELAARPAGGGGGGSLQWVEDADSPTPGVEYGVLHYAYGAGLTQKLKTSITVPSSYSAGDPVTLKVPAYSSDTTGDLKMLLLTLRIRPGVDAIYSTSNLHASTNAAITLSGATEDIPQIIEFDVTDGVGQIDSVDIEPGDLLLITLLRDTDTSALDAKILPYLSEVSFS